MKRKISIEYNVQSLDGKQRFDPVEIPVDGYDPDYWDYCMKGHPDETPNWVFNDYGVHQNPETEVTYYQAFIHTDKPTQYWMDLLNTYDEKDSVLATEAAIAKATTNH